MGRNVKRVALDFDWPMLKGWPGYVNPACEACKDRNCDHCREHEDSDCYDPTWREYDPPAGEGWQMWEDTSEGSPISPVFDTPEKLARWLADTGASAFGDMTATYEAWLHTIRGRGCGVGLVFGGGRPMQSTIQHTYDRDQGK